MKEVNENGRFFGAEEALEVDEGVQLKEGFLPPKRVNILNKSLCMYRICMDGKSLTTVEPRAEKHGWEQSQTTAAPASHLALSRGWDQCVMCW